MYKHSNQRGCSMSWGTENWVAEGIIAGRRWLWQSQGQQQGEKFLGFFSSFLPFFILKFLAAMSHTQHWHPIGEGLHFLHYLCGLCYVFYYIGYTNIPFEEFLLKLFIWLEILELLHGKAINKDIKKKRECDKWRVES